MPADAVSSRIVLDARLGPLHYPIGDEVMAPTIATTGRWEPMQAQWLDEVVRPGMTVLNVGANVGYFACWSAQLAGSRGIVLAVEPDPENATLLRRNTAGRQGAQITCLEVAASDAPGTLRLYRDPRNPGDHRVYATPERADLPWVDVPAVRLDDAIEEISGQRSLVVDVVVCDCQGWDHRALRGLAETLRRHRPAVTVEFSPSMISRMGDSPWEVLSQYEAYGYRLGYLELGIPPGGVGIADVLDELTRTDRPFVTVEMWPQEIEQPLRIRAGSGFWPAEQAGRTRRQWLVAPASPLWFSGPAGQTVRAVATVEPPPCGPVDLRVGHERRVLDVAEEMTFVARLDSRGVARLDLAADPVCRVAGDPRPLRVALTGLRVVSVGPDDATGGR